MADNGSFSPSNELDSPSAFPSSGKGADAMGKIDRAASAVGNAVDQLADKAEPARERLHEVLDSAATAVKSQVHRLDQVQDAWLTGAREYVREHPFASIFAAAAVGMLYGKLTNR